MEDRVNNFRVGCLHKVLVAKEDFPTQLSLTSIFQKSTFLLVNFFKNNLKFMGISTIIQS